MQVCQEGSADNEIGFSTGDTVGANKSEANNRTTLQRSKVDESAESGGKRANNAR